MLRRGRVAPDVTVVAACAAVALVGRLAPTGVFVVDALERAALVAIAGASQVATPPRELWRVAAGCAAALAVVLLPFTNTTAPLIGAGWMVLAFMVLSTPRGRRIAAVAAAACVVVSLPGGVAVLKARAAANAAQARFDAVGALGLSQADAARTVGAIHHDTARARAALVAPWAMPSRVVPVVGNQLRVANNVATGVNRLMAVAARRVDDLDPARFAIRDRRIPVDAIASARPAAVEVARAARVAADAADGARGSWLVPPLQHAVDDVARRARDAANTASLAADATGHLPAILGGTAPRTYFLMVQNPAEARASGGILGSYAEVHAQGGKLTLGTVGRDSDLNAMSEGKPRATGPGFAHELAINPGRFWQNETLSPDFPSVASQVLSDYTNTGHHADGVISVDPDALAAILDVTGPVSVNDWPEPLTTDNITAVLEHDQYVRFPENQGDAATSAMHARRDAFLAGAVSTIWTHLLDNPNLDVTKLLRVLGDAGRHGHLQMFSATDAEQSLFVRSGLAGNFPAARGDLVAVVTQNASASKIDWYLHRSVTYRPTIDAAGGLRATVTIRLRNDAPASGVSDYVLGLADGERSPGKEIVHLGVYTPWAVQAVSVDGTAAQATSDRELGVNVHSLLVSVGPGQSRTVRFTLTGKWPGHQPYSLVVRQQVLIHGDAVTVFDPSGRGRLHLKGPFQGHTLWYP